jgi:hypothetical protein
MRNIFVTGFLVLVQSLAGQALEYSAVDSLKVRCEGIDRDFGALQILVVSETKNQTFAHLVIGMQTVAEVEITLTSATSWDADEPAMIEAKGTDFNLQIDPQFNTAVLKTSLNGKPLSDSLQCEIFGL